MLEEKNGKFIYFNDNDEDVTNWIYLEIKATKL
jgi:hypothetical protein